MWLTNLKFVPIHHYTNKRISAKYDTNWTFLFQTYIIFNCKLVIFSIKCLHCNLQHFTFQILKPGLIFKNTIFKLWKLIDSITQKQQSLSRIQSLKNHYPWKNISMNKIAPLAGNSATTIALNMAATIFFNAGLPTTTTTLITTTMIKEKGVQ